MLKVNYGSNISIPEAKGYTYRSTKQNLMQVLKARSRWKNIFIYPYLYITKHYLNLIFDLEYYQKEKKTKSCPHFFCQTESVNILSKKFHSLNHFEPSANSSNVLWCQRCHWKHTENQIPPDFQSNLIIIKLKRSYQRMILTG